MPKFELVHHDPGGDSHHYPIGETDLVIGRAPDIDIVLQDKLVSRRHAVVSMKSGRLAVTDLSSVNGITVNGERVSEQTLKAGDRIEIGESVFVVYAPDDTGGSTTRFTSAQASAHFDEMLREESQGALYLLYQASQLLGTVFDLDELLERILALIIEALPISRGYVLSFDAKSGEPTVRATRFRDSDTGPPLSKTMIKHVVDHGDALLTVNAQEDDRFEGAASVLAHGIHAAMCVPLFGRDDTVGAIYVDSGTSQAVFSDDDLRLLTAFGRVVGVAVENARLYQENIEKERLAAIGEATAGIAHCVKNILTGLKGGSDFVKRGIQNLDWKWVNKGWPIMDASLDRIETLVLNLLTISKDREPARVPTDVNGLIAEIVEMSRLRAEKLNVVLDFDRGDVGILYLDGREVYRAFLNVLSNAIEACEEEGGLVTVSTCGDAKGCTIRFTDTGVGISPELLSKLPKAFVSTKGSRGTGLGLTCTYKIVRENGGDVAVASEEGVGTTVTITLPRLKAPPPEVLP